MADDKIKPVEENRSEIALPVGQGVPKEPKELIMGNKDEFVNAILQFKKQIGELVQAGALTDQVAIRIITEQEYNFFQQFIQIQYK